MRRTYVPPEMAPSARELILAFGRWCDEHMDLVESEDWTYEDLVDMFLMECGANGEISSD